VSDVLKIPALGALNGIRHGFFTRNGGESQGLYTSNNCAYGANDVRETVTRNRARCAAELGLSSLITAYQRHTADVVTVTEPWTPEAAPVADGMVTRIPGIGLGILTADCGPVLFADAQAGVVGAAHAGWRGAFDGVVQNTVAAMRALGAKPASIVAALGPCIAQASYEVGAEFVANFVARDPAYASYFTEPKSNGRSHFDLPAFVAAQLRAAGVGTVVINGSDTCATDHLFFSFRRSTLNKEPDYGRQISVIGLLP
jgi:YfiH family protein